MQWCITLSYRTRKLTQARLTSGKAAECPENIKRRCSLYSFIFQNTYTHTHTHIAHIHQPSTNTLSLYTHSHTFNFRHNTTGSTTCPLTAATLAMSQSNNPIPKPTLTLDPLDIKRICVVHWNTEPLVEGEKSSFVFVKPLREAEPLPNNQGILKISGDRYKQLSNDSTEVFRLGDQINIIFSHKTGHILKWLERRDESQADLGFNQLFT